MSLYSAATFTTPALCTFSTASSATASTPEPCLKPPRGPAEVGWPHNPYTEISHDTKAPGLPPAARGPRGPRPAELPDPDQLPRREPAGHRGGRLQQ